MDIPNVDSYHSRQPFTILYCDCDIAFELRIHEVQTQNNNYLLVFNLLIYDSVAQSFNNLIFNIKRMTELILFLLNCSLLSVGL